jgi:DNA-binding CsgD family transcriptional regulator
MPPDAARNLTSSKCECGRTHLTDRQAELLALRAAGLTRREIAEKLMISIRTVDDHFMMIASRTGIHDSVELNSLAHAFGILIAGVPPFLTKKRCWGPLLAKARPAAASGRCDADPALCWLASHRP